MSVFDITLLQNAEITEAGDTSIVPVPEGEWTAVLTKYEIKSVKGKDGEAPVCEVYWDIDDQQVQDVTGRDKNTVRQSLWLDLTTSGTLDMGRGKNVALNKLRDALGQNVNGKKWAFGMLVGQVAKIMVGHRVSDDGTINANVKKVSAL